VAADRLGDGDEGDLIGPELADQRARIKIEADPRQQRAGAPVERGPVDQAAPAQRRFFAKEQILAHGKLRQRLEC